MNEESKLLIDEISKISDHIKKDIKPLVQRLAKNIADNLKSAEIINLAKLQGIEDPQPTDVVHIIERLRKKYEWSFGRTSLFNYIQKEYKTTLVEEYAKPVRVNDNYIETHIDELKDKIKDWEKKHTPAKDIITKARVEDMEKYTWRCHLAEELAMLAIKLEKEHMAEDQNGNFLAQHEDKLCADYAKRAKRVRDSRFATNTNAYEAIILACNVSDSLKNSISGEYSFKTVWEVRDDEDKCRECIQEKCRSESCKHECHRVVRPMTTKGLKYAIKTDEDLSELDAHIKRLAEIGNDICGFGKIILENPKAKKKLGIPAMKRVIYAHIEKDECFQCDHFLEKNPTFFDEG